MPTRWPPKLYDCFTTHPRWSTLPSPAFSGFFSRTCSPWSWSSCRCQPVGAVPVEPRLFHPPRRRASRTGLFDPLALADHDHAALRDRELRPVELEIDPDRGTLGDPHVLVHDGPTDHR